MTFEQACREAAAEFLQTVVLVDDRAAFSGQDSSSPAKLEGKILEDEELQEPGDMESAPVEEQRSTPMVGGGEELDAGVITRGFAAEGLVCAVLKPENGESLQKETLKAAERADIVVLDWEMGDQGQKAMALISGLLESDHSHGDRLRLVVIYTGRTQLRSIRDEVAEKVQGLVQEEGTALALVSRSKTTKVVVLGKGTSNAHDEKEWAVEANALPNRLITEFATFTGGLLPNATLGSMAELRRNTHKLLARFNKRMDGPLITHHALLGSPKDAEQFLADLIIQELEAQIPLGRISNRYAGVDSIEAYLKDRIDQGKKPKVVFEIDGQHEASLELPVAVQLVRDGPAVLKANIEEFIKQTKQSKAKLQGCLDGSRLADRLYCLNGDSYEAGKSSHEEFAVASSIRRCFEDVDPGREDLFPTLKLGSIVHDGQSYLLCLTPVCDSVRKKGDRANFVFARLDEGAAAFSLVVKDGGTRKRLTIDRKDVHFRTIELKPSGDETVRSKLAEDKSKLVFEPAPPRENEGAGTELRWVAEMKPMQAQRIVTAVTSNLSRIGLDEFEWQRIQAPRWS